MLENAARLHFRRSPQSVNRNYAIDIFRKVDEDGDIAALPRKTRAAAAHHQWRAMFATKRNAGDDVVDGARHDDADRHLPVVRCIRGVESAAAAVKTNFAVRVAPQRGRECAMPIGRGLKRACDPPTWRPNDRVRSMPGRGA